MTPSMRVSRLSWRKYPAIAVAANIKGISRIRVWERTEIAPNSAVMPNTKVMLAIFDPNTLPMAVFVMPSMDAVAATNISGAELPIATMVNPINIGGSPRLRAKAAAP